MSQLLILHRFFESRGLLPEKTLPRWEIGALEQGMLKNGLNTTESLNHIGSVIVEIPELTIMLLMCPPEGILLKDLILLEILSHSPSLIVSKGQSILLE